MMFVCDHSAKILAFDGCTLGVFVSNAGFVCFPQISQIGADFLPLAPCLLPLFCFPQMARMDADFLFQISDFRFLFPADCADGRRFFCLRWYGIFAAYVRKFPCLRAEKERRKVLTRKANGLVALSAGHRPADRDKEQEIIRVHLRQSAGNKTEARGKEQEARNPRQSAKSAGNRNLKSEI